MNPEFKEWLDKNKTLLIVCLIFAFVWFKVVYQKENLKSSQKTSENINNNLNESPISKVRDNSVIGIPIKFGTLEIAQSEFPEKMNWRDAKKACKELGDGWRMPTIDELYELYQNKRQIGGFGTYYYWSSTPDYTLGNNAAWWQSFGGVGTGGGDKGDELYVRAVRTY
jgi:hypothetical protein